MVRKSKSRDYLLIASAVLGLVAFISKEVIQAELANLRESLAAAESQFSHESDQSALQIQILAVQQQIQVLQIPKSGPAKDYSPLIAEDTALARQLTSSLDADFDALSKLVDALPARRTDLRDVRDKVYMGVENVDKNTTETLVPSSDHSAYRSAQVVGVKLYAMVMHIPVIMAGDLAQTAAHQLIDAYDALIRFCTRMAYVCGSLAAILFAHSAIVRGKSLG